MPRDDDPLVRLAVRSADAARGLAGNLLACPRGFDDPEVAAIEPDDLADAFARDTFAAARWLYRESGGRGVDAAAVYTRLSAGDRWDRSRLRADLADLIEAGGVGASIGFYAREVRDTHRRRELHAAAVEMQRLALDHPGDADGGPDLAAEAGALLDRATADRAARDVATVAEAVEDGLADIRRRRDPAARRVRTGLAEVDDLLGGLDPGQMVVVAARPAVGKSAFALSVAWHAAAVDRVPVYLASLEMSRAELGQRVAGMLTGAPTHLLRTGRGTDDDLARVGRAARVAAGVPLFIDDTPGLKLAQIRAAAWRVKRRAGLGLVVLDYLQLIEDEAASRKRDRREVVEQVSRRTKQLARELEVPVIALAQLNRDCEKRPDGRPVLSDLRESGSIEQDADAVLLLWKPPGQPDGAAEVDVGLAVAKHRNGPVGEVRLIYRPSCTRFEDKPPLM